MITYEEAVEEELALAREIAPDMGVTVEAFLAGKIVNYRCELLDSQARLSQLVARMCDLGAPV